MLLDECAKGAVQIKLGAPIGAISHRDGIFEVAGAQAPHLVVATGGPSIPKMGATGIAYDIAAQFGLDLVTPEPALVPFTLGAGDEALKAISGVATPGSARTGKTSFEEAILFTHRGVSGPAILQISSYWQAGASIDLTLLPQAHAALRQTKTEMPRAHLKAALAAHLPKRLAEVLAPGFDVKEEMANVPDATLDRVADALTTFTLTPTGTEGYAKAEVTKGGIDTAGLSSKTMEARDISGLYFIGEAVDVTGWLGGYNFQWAWSSGVAAGRAIGARLQV